MCPHKSVAQGQSEGTPSALPGHRVTETPKCVAPSVEREWQAPGKESCTKVFRVGSFPGLPWPGPEESKEQ